MLLILDVGGAELLTDCPGGTKDDFEVSPAETYVKLQKKKHFYYTKSES